MRHLLDTRTLAREDAHGLNMDLSGAKCDALSR